MKQTTRRFTDKNEGFICAHCGAEVPPAAQSCRNHCPYCLYSVHLDNNPGDRASDCRGLMAPVEIVYHSKKGYQILHRCQVCGTEKRNILLLEDRIMPDDLDRAFHIMKHLD